MEKTPYRASLDLFSVVSGRTAITSAWRDRLPVLSGQRVMLRELRPSDAESLWSVLNTEEVGRFISRPPTTVDGFEQFIASSCTRRAAGREVCFAITIAGHDTAIGVIQVRQKNGRFETAEWGFAIGSAFWGSGMFEESAALAIDFAFEVLGVHRLEARAAVLNGRGAAALTKIGAVQECLMRKSFRCEGKVLDQGLFTILDTDRSMTQTARMFRAEQVH
jgi:RimJ/RimL family protein N-acetyltransferase